MNPFHDTGRHLCSDQMPFDPESAEKNHFIGDSRCSQGRGLPYERTSDSGDTIVMITCLAVLGWILSDCVSDMLRGLI